MFGWLSEWEWNIELNYIGMKNEMINLIKIFRLLLKWISQWTIGALIKFWEKFWLNKKRIMKGREKRVFTREGLE